MGLSPYLHGRGRAGYRFATRGTSDYRLDRVVSKPPTSADQPATRWDQEDARQSLRDQVLTHLASPHGVLVLDESAFVKANGKFVGAHRMTGDGGAPLHLQTGVFLAYSGPRGNGYLDRELFLPRPWIERSDLRTSSGVPADIAYSTRPQMAHRMLERALAHQIPHRFIAGTITFGADKDLRAWLEERQEAYVMAIPADLALLMDGGYVSAGQLIMSRMQDTAFVGRSDDGADAWRCLRVPVTSPGRSGSRAISRSGWERWLLASCATRGSEPAECFMAYVRAATSLEDMVDAVHAARRIRDGMSEARETVGLDRFTGKSWEGWYRHMTVALMAHTVLGLARGNRRYGAGSVRPPHDRNAGD